MFGKKTSKAEAFALTALAYSAVSFGVGVGWWASQRITGAIDAAGEGVANAITKANKERKLKGAAEAKVLEDHGEEAVAEMDDKAKDELVKAAMAEISAQGLEVVPETAAVPA